MPQRLTLILLILYGVLGTLTGTALPRDDQAFQRGMAAFERQDYTTALREWQALAQQGHSVAQVWLGLMYQNGWGVAEDLAEAVKWFRKAADRGSALAQFTLGDMYETGQGVAKDLAEAQRWFAHAAETFPPGLFRDTALQARERVARQLATAQPARPQPTPTSPSTPAAVAPPPPPVVTASPPSTANRRALVIGNTKYPGNPLRNPGNDAKAMATFLAKEAGFQVYQGQALLDLDRHILVNALSDFAESLRRDDIVVFYFSGHGLERQGLNYLIPINFAPKTLRNYPMKRRRHKIFKNNCWPGSPPC